MFLTAALVLAAGSSSRMGTPKHLLPLGNSTAIRHGVETLVAAGISDIVVVANAHDRGCAEALQGTPALVVHNTAITCEMADSVRRGLQELDEDRHSGVLLCLADHPLVSVDTCRTLVCLHHEAPTMIIIPAFHERRGHPTLFPMDILGDIFFAESLRDIVREDAGRVLVINVPDEGVVLDMDTPEDYQAILKKYASLSPAPTPAKNCQPK